jgi:ATP-dependent RNA helicase CshB
LNSFKDYNFNNKINNVLDNINFTKPTMIQKEVIPLLRKNINVVGISQTGSGKTHAFLLPIIENINLNINKPQALILTPTRELAIQIANNLTYFTNEIDDLKVSLLIGGTDLDETQELTSQIIVGSAGRILDAISNRHVLKLDYIKYTILDEADMIFDDNFIKEIDKIMSFIKNSCFGVFSATISKNMQPFFRKYFNGIKVVEIKADLSNIEHDLVFVKEDDRYLTLQLLLSNINPYLCLVFASTKELVNEIYHKLNDEGIKCGLLHGDLDNRERTKMLKRINNLEYNIVICSDIASRGIDIEGVSHVISYDLPYELIYYTHRAGRTGRAKYTGISYVIYDNNDAKKIGYLVKSGINFNYLTFNDNNELVSSKAIVRNKYQFKNDNNDNQALKKITSKKIKKVKPGYKKKRKEQIEKIMKKERQAKIKERIKKQRKQRKNNGNSFN